MTKYYANKGVARNKKPLKNIEVKLEKSISEPNKFKLYKRLQGDKLYGYFGLISKEDIKEMLSEKQFNKFMSGTSEFIIQRRFNGKNIKTK